MTRRYHRRVHRCLWRILSASMTAVALTLFILAAAVLQVVIPPPNPMPLLETPLPSLPAPEDDDILITMAWLSNSNSSWKFNLVSDFRKESQILYFVYSYTKYLYLQCVPTGQGRCCSKGSATSMLIRND